MKMKIFCLSGVLCLLALTGKGQADIFNPIRDALKAGSAKELVKYFNASVDIDLDGDERTYSKAQAELVMRDFFKKQGVAADFNIIHNGSSVNGDLQFAIGKYQNATASYSVLIRVREVDKSFLVHEIKFRKE